MAAGGFFGRTIATTGAEPVEVVTDRAATYPIGREELLPAAWHRTDRYANNGVEADHGRLKAQLRPMCGLKQDRSAWVVIGGHALVHNLRRGHYELAAEEPPSRRLMVAFDELPLARSGRMRLLQALVGHPGHVADRTFDAEPPSNTPPSW